MKILKRKHINAITPYLYLLPALLIILCVLGFPLVYNIIISFFDWDLRKPIKAFTGFNNYKDIITSPKFIKVFTTTVIWTVVGVLFQMVIGIGLALFVDSRKKVKKFLQSIILIPWLIPGVVTALMWTWMLQSDMGIINRLIELLGISKANILWLSDPKYALGTLIIINTWKATPYWFLMVVAGLQDLPTEQVESARIDGAGYFEILKNVTLPHLKPIIAATGVITSIWTLNYFDLIWVTTKGGPMDVTSTLPIYTYRLGFEFFKFGQSAAMAVVTLILVTLLCIPYIKVMLSSIKEGGA